MEINIISCLCNIHKLFFTHDVDVIIKLMTHMSVEKISIFKTKYSRTRWSFLRQRKTSQ
jgi:hypothetical protein